MFKMVVKLIGYISEDITLHLPEGITLKEILEEFHPPLSGRPYKIKCCSRGGNVSISSEQFEELKDVAFYSSAKEWCNSNIVHTNIVYTASSLHYYMDHYRDYSYIMYYPDVYRECGSCYMGFCDRPIPDFLDSKYFPNLRKHITY